MSVRSRARDTLSVKTLERILAVGHTNTTPIGVETKPSDLTTKSSGTTTLTFEEIHIQYLGNDGDSVNCKGVKFVSLRADYTGPPKIVKICELFKDEELRLKATKSDPPRQGITEAEFDQEVVFAQKASEIEVGPKVYNVFKIEGTVKSLKIAYGVIEMQEFAKVENLKKIFDAFSSAQSRERGGLPAVKRCAEDCPIVNVVDDDLGRAYQTAVLKMWNEGDFLHMDLHQENIFYHDKRVYFIDFGMVLTKETILKSEKSVQMAEKKALEAGMDKKDVDEAKRESAFKYKPREWGGHQATIFGPVSAYQEGAFDVTEYVASMLLSQNFITQEVADFFLKPL